MSRKIFGLDIRHDAVAAVLVDSSMKGVEIERQEYVEFADVDGDEALRTALEIVTSGLDSSETVCVTAVPPHRLSFRNLQIPFRENKKIKQVLPFELEPVLPFPIEDLEIEFQIVSPSESTGRTRIFAAAAEKETLNTLKAALKPHGVEPHTITIRGWALAANISRMPQAPDQFVVIDIDGPRMTGIAVHQGQICMMRAMQAHGNRPRALATGVRQLEAAVAEALDIEYSAGKLFLAGDGSADDATVTALNDALEIPVESVDLCRGGGATILGGNTGDWRPEKMDHALALALFNTMGVGAINFGRRSFGAVKQWMAYKKYAVPTLVLAAAVVVFALGGSVFEQYMLSKQQDEIDRQMLAVFTSAFPTEKRVVDPLKQMQGKINELRANSLAGSEPERKALTIDILDEISKRIPREIDVALSQFIVAPDNITIAGNTATFNMVDDIKNGLEVSDLFQKVTISSANSDRSGNRVTFKLKIEL